MEGRVFSERTKPFYSAVTARESFSTYKLSPEQELVIRSEESRKESRPASSARIASDADTFIYGIAFLDRETNFWGIDFPDLSETEKRASQTLLECSNCHTRETADHSDLASDVMAINDSIVRYCQKCGSSTYGSTQFQAACLRWRVARRGEPARRSGIDGRRCLCRSTVARPQLGNLDLGNLERTRSIYRGAPSRQSHRPLGATANASVTLEQPPAFAGAA